MSKTILLIGLSGHGKSTTGNCLLNKSGDEKNITEEPFRTSNGASGCTIGFKTAQTDDFIVLDTVGFGDPQFTDQKKILNDLKMAIQSVGNQIDCVLFVVREGRFTNETVQFFETVQEKVLRKNFVENSILIASSAREGWLRQQSGNPFVQRAMRNCNNVGYDFNLKFDDSDDEEAVRAKNLNKRQTAIDNLVSFVKGKCSEFGKVNVDYIQSAEFETEWLEKIAPILGQILYEIVGLFAPPAVTRMLDKCKQM